MIIVKFIVLFGCISVFSALQTNYCNVCSNHTLCQYKIPGPSAACQLYDSTALLSSKEIQDLVQKINEKRNFIAMGHSTFLPQAANMNKVHWSNELARFAQRWADQCNPFLHPDIEDDCRDLGIMLDSRLQWGPQLTSPGSSDYVMLAYNSCGFVRIGSFGSLQYEHAKVGQSIASVVGTSLGLNVKSFIEIWFMQILDYVGTVTYYNQSRDYKTNYFTQLIWAETEFVGCGKVKFYVHERKMTMVRLVCNFAPKGNIDGKPVYAIGYAGTQCNNNNNIIPYNNNVIPDKEFQGLCNYDNAEISKKTTMRYPVSSLLRILNLSNDSMKQDIDPINNNYKERNHKRNRQRNQKTRHLSANNSHDTVRRPLLRKLNMRNNLIQNTTKDDEYLYQTEQGHSRLYHGQEETPLVPMYTTHYFEGNNNQYILNHDYTFKPVYLISSPNYRKYNLHPQCTRHRAQSQFCCDSHHCTRGQHHCCQRSTRYQSETFTNPTVPSTLCPQTTKCMSTCPTICPPLFTIVDNCKTDCICSRDAFQSCKHVPNMLRSGNHKKPRQFSTLIQETEQYYDSNLSETYKIKHENKTTGQLNEHSNKDMVRLKYNDDRDYFYRSIDSSLRKKRQGESEVSIQPFWKLNDMNYENAFELKALRYTTLPNRKKIKTRTNMQPIISPITESITIKKNDYSNNENEKENGEEEKITEKYLSFDELMYLRKLSDNYMDYNPRRQSGKKKNSKKSTDKKKAKATTKTTKKVTTKGTAKATTKAANKPLKAVTKATTKTTAKPTTKPVKKATTKATIKTTTTKPTTEYTANTPFERKKQCTRRLTCTWTIFTGIAEDGKQIGPIEVGSRTPPGYVEGCTRTSTCTRDFMERNKMASTSGDSEANGATGEADDGDYCEKRSLKLHRRNSEQKDETLASITRKDFLNLRTNNLNFSKSRGCVCDRKLRVRRQESVSLKDASKVISYADLYYLVLNKMMKTNEAESRNTNKCLCNSSSNYRNVSFCPFCFLLLLIL